MGYRRGACVKMGRGRDGWGAGVMDGKVQWGIGGALVGWVGCGSDGEA